MDAFGKVVIGVVLVVAAAVMVIAAGRFIQEAANWKVYAGQTACPKVDSTISEP